MHVISLDKLGPLSAPPSPLAAAAAPPLALVQAAAPGDIVEQLAAVATKRAAAAAQLAAAKVAKAAEADDPAVQLAEATLALRREEREARLAVHEVAVDKLYRTECLSRTEEMVARLTTIEGSVLLRAETEKETAVRMKMCGALRDRADATSDRQEREGLLSDEEEQAQSCFRGLVLSDSKHFAALVAKYPGAWFAIARVVTLMASAQVALAGKDAGR